MTTAGTIGIPNNFHTRAETPAVGRTLARQWQAFLFGSFRRFLE